MINGFTYLNGLYKTVESGCARVNVAALSLADVPKINGVDITSFQIVDSEFKEFQGGNIFLSSLILDNNIIDRCVEYILTTQKKFMVRCSSTLDEVGYFDAKYKLSPIMILYKLGLLSNSFIVGGAYLDKEDIALIKQENASVILTPTFDCGYGNGFPQILSLLESEVEIILGSADNKYNSSADMNLEKYVLTIGSNCIYKKENVLGEKIKNILF